MRAATRGRAWWPGAAELLLAAGATGYERTATQDAE